MVRLGDPFPGPSHESASMLRPDLDQYEASHPLFLRALVDNIEVGGEKAVVVIDWLGGEEIRRSNLYSTQSSRMSMAAHTW